MKNPNYLLELEKAIKEKYGEDAIKDFRINWDEQKEKNYLQQIKELYNIKKEHNDFIEIKGVLIPEKLFIKENSRSCNLCNTYSFSRNDDLYLTKYECCFKCYVNFIEGREEKWIKKQSQENNLKKS